MNKIKDFFESRIFIALMLCALIIIASVPAFRSAVYDGHDLKFHFGRIQAIAEALQAGQFPVRYEQNAWYGHGYVSSLFYGNIFLYFPAVLYMLGMPVFRAYNVYVIIVNIATVLVGYYSFKKILKDNYMALAGIVFYTLAGYRLTNLYVRTSLGEYTAMVFVPLCLYGIYKIYTDESKRSLLARVLPLIIGMTGLIQSHVLTTELVAAFMFIFAILNCRGTIAAIKELLVAVLATLGINAFFIIPFLDSYTSLKLNINSTMFVESIKENGLYLSQIFGLLTEGRGENMAWSTEREWCYNVGALMLVAELAILVYVIWAIVKRGKKNKYFLQITGLGIFATWITTVYFPWDTVATLGGFGKLMTSVQYPCRYMTIACTCFSLAGAYAAGRLIRNDNKRIIFVFTICAVALITTGIFDYTLSFGKNMTNEHTIEEWADKLYLPVGTDAEALTETLAVEKDNEIILPVLAYDNVQVFDKDNNRIETHVSDNNCLAVEKGVDVDSISVRYIEPMLWRISEILSLASIVGLLIYIFIERSCQR